MPRRRCRAQTATHHCTTTTPTQRRRHARPDCWHGREGRYADGQLSLARGPALTDFARQKKVFFRRRAADRQDRVPGERQPLHLPPARLHLQRTGGHAGARGRCAQEEALGHRLPYGQSAVATPFKKLLAQAQPDAGVRGRQAAPLEQGGCRQRGAGPGRRQARRHLQHCCSRPTWRALLCARATRAACSRARSGETRHLASLSTLTQNGSPTG